MTYEEFRDRLTYNITKLMRKNGYNQTVLADKAGISQGAVSTLLSGQRDPSIYVLWTIAEALEVQPDKLLGEVEYGKDIYLRKRKKVQGNVVGNSKRP